MYKNLFILTFVLFCSFVTAEEQTVRKAAYDLGSGSFKLLIVDMKGEKVERIVHSNIQKVRLGQDLAESGDKKQLSATIQEVALKAIKELNEEAKMHGATESTGVATAAFRNATNGKDLLTTLSKETNISLEIIPQEFEGVLGFQTAVALTPEVDAQNIIAWDCGGASFQISMLNNGKHLIFEGPIGASQASKLLQEEVRGESYSQTAQVLPIQREEMEKYIPILQKQFGHLQSPLKNKLESNKSVVIGIGDEDSLFGLVDHFKKPKVITQAILKELIDDLSVRSEQDPIFGKYQPKSVVTRLALMYAIMTKLNIQEVVFKPVDTGSAIGIMLCPELWE